jgi:hypothetical protein
MKNLRCCIPTAPSVLRHAGAVLLLTAVLLPLPQTVRGQACPDPAALTRGLAGSIATVRYLADEALEGRLAGSPGERCAGEYIAERFRALGLQPAGAEGSYFQDVPLASVVNPHAPGGTGRNVAALLQGSDPERLGEIVVIGAHYDHLGRGAFGSLEPDHRGAIHSGADDNASGVAAMLRAAELLTQQRPGRSILFLAFTGEEAGLLGSAHFVRNATVPVSGMRAMLNMDMVGRLGAGPLIIYGVDTAAEWRAVLEAEASRLELDLALRGEGYGPSDHTSFYIQDVPVLHFFTNTHSDYHRPSDSWDRIDAPGLERVARLVAAVAYRIGEPAVRLTLQRGAGEPPRHGSGRAGSGAWLGTVPDFSPVARGVLLGGVTAGSPGEQAGLRKGDVLIRFGAYDVADLEGLTEALRAHAPGDEVELVVLRDGQSVRLRATLGRRGG